MDALLAGCIQSHSFSQGQNSFHCVRGQKTKPEHKEVRQVQNRK